MIQENASQEPFAQMEHHVEPNITVRRATVKERGIIMSGDNPRLIQERRKTQTRRIMASKWFKLEMCKTSKPPHLRYREFNHRRGDGIYESGSGPFDVSDFSESGSQWYAATFCPYGVAGDRLWVREAFNGISLTPKHPMEAITYRADAGPHERSLFVWTPSIHMPRKFSRITLEITKVRVERLQDISVTDARREGIRCGRCKGSPNNIGACCCREHYSALWDSLHGQGSWEKNPWLWVLEFRVICPKS